MAADDKTPTGRDLDKALELEEARLSERVRMRLDSHEDEDSTVIEQRALEATKSDSTPAPAKGLVAVLKLLPPWQRGIVVLALIAAVVATGATKIAGLW